MALPITALIIDDEPLARQELEYLLDAAGDVSVLAQGSNGIDAVELIRSHKPDVVFLDVRMPGLDGFAVLKKVLALDRKTKLPQIVFATAFDQYAVKAFEVNAVDYLLKPFDSKRVVKTLEKVRAQIGNQTGRPDRQEASTGKGEAKIQEVKNQETKIAEAKLPATVAASTGRVAGLVAGAEAKLDALLRMVEQRAVSSSGAGMPRSGKVVVRAQNRLLLVDERELCFATIEDGTISVVTRTVEGESNYRTLEELQDQLDPEQFFRAHRSFLVNLRHIREVVPWFKSTYQLRMDDRKQTEIPVSRNQAKRLREIFKL
jgi:two-component system LytT family response regulator/two-component system response regulator LytT